MTTTNPTPASREFLFLMSSTRRNGNAEILARHAAKSLPTEWKQVWLRHIDLPIDPFEDIRHGDSQYDVPTGNLRLLAEATLSATDLVFVAPTYWYALPTHAKHYLDHWTAWMRAPGLDFKPRMAGKKMWAVTIVADPDKSTTVALLKTLELNAKYMKMDWAGSVVGYANRPGNVLNDAEALAEAEKLFK
ncbi:flavodoxin family protein [Bradyrhizobium sp. BR 1432]|uniref:flavodoxin family protein n=1 Tax=Bradyrhizobium sp. BR 1432 TaxID=3447966 RepID=UPI003EE5CCA5